MAVVEAVKPLQRRALEKQGMTEEMELSLLIQEQEADDVYRVDRPAKVISFDGPAGDGKGSVSDFVAEVDGEVVSFLPRSSESLFFIASFFKHSTFDAYNNKGCRCRPCKTFMAEYRRQKRAA